MQQRRTPEAQRRRAATLATLPPLSFATIGGEVVIIKRGERGVFRLTGYHSPVTADQLNDAWGVSQSVAAAMMIGANFGWEAPGASPEWWGE